MKLAHIIIHRSTHNLHNSLMYLIPDTMTVAIGMRVYVPLGSSHEEGIVVGIEDGSRFDIILRENTYVLLNHNNKPEIRLRSISKVLDQAPWFSQEMLDTASKISSYYLMPHGEALSLFTINKKVKKGYTRPTLEVYSLKEEPIDIKTLSRKPKQYALIQFLQKMGPMRKKELQKRGFSDTILRAIKALPCIQITHVFQDTKTFFPKSLWEQEIPLTREQSAAYTLIQQSIQDEEYKTFLLHGVTGSGKTQVYMKAVQETLAMGKTAIILVPEITLSYQIVKRFSAIFGDEVVVFHSELTPEERYNSWERLRRGESHIIIGARSAIFAPLDNIGLIVLDEEHDASYKDWEHSHYHARKVAMVRAAYYGATVILGSATPSISSYYKAQTGIYQLLSLTERVHQKSLPNVQIVDMKEELFYGNRSVFSEALRNLISDTLLKKKQIILLLNRRGYATFVLCRDCGHVMNCPHCNTSLVYHKRDHLLRCHYCEYTLPIPKVCPECQSTRIKFFGSGTQKIEELLQKEYPEARIARLDLDVKRVKHKSKEILDAFAKGEYDILLGTQMIAKGHDFPNVTAVGIITADSALHIANYTAAEYTFSLLTQVAGRAGRGDMPGHAIIQTYNPSHYAIMYSKTHDYEGFYKEELVFRKSLGYPPLGELMKLTVQGKNLHKVEKDATHIVEVLTKEFENHNTIEILGPYEENIHKINDVYRTSIMIKGPDISNVKEYIYSSTLFFVDGLKIDVDPI